MSASNLTLPQLKTRIGKLTADRNAELRKIEDQINALQARKYDIMTSYDGQVRILKRQLINRERLAGQTDRTDELRELKVALAKLNRDSKAGIHEQDGGLLRDFIMEVRKSISGYTTANPKLEEIRENMDLSWYNDEIRYEIEDVMRFYDDWDRDNARYYTDVEQMRPARPTTSAPRSRSPSPLRRMPSYYDSTTDPLAELDDLL